jgi:hypothetical protein
MAGTAPSAGVLRNCIIHNCMGSAESSYLNMCVMHRAIIGIFDESLSAKCNQVDPIKPVAAGGAMAGAAANPKRKSASGRKRAVGEGV